MPEDRPARERLNTSLLVLLCFLLTSTAYLAWVYRLVEIVPAHIADVLSMVCGYLLQAAGIAAFMRLGAIASETHLRRIAVASALACAACLAPATLSRSLPAILASGFAGNLACGLLAGYYLSCLAVRVEAAQRGRAFGVGYAGATTLAWLLSLACGGTLLRGIPALALCCVLCALIASLIARKTPRPATTATTRDEQSSLHRKDALLACSVVLLASVVKNMGYSFPAADLASGVSLELSRLSYGLGLVAAGIVADRSRRYGGLCCACALVMPFLMLALRGAHAPATALWAIDYLLYGFFSVFRVALLADLASESGRPHLAGAGLLLGRMGDAVGTALCILLADSPLALITTASLLFVCSMALFFALDQHFFAPTPMAEGGPEAAPEAEAEEAVAEDAE